MYYFYFRKQGNKIPTWMKIEEIKIQIEDMNCTVLESSDTELTCSSPDVNESYNSGHVTQPPVFQKATTPEVIPEVGTKALTQAKEFNANLNKFLNNETSNETLYVNVSITLGNFQENHTVSLQWHQVNVGNPMLLILAAVGGCSSAVVLAVCVLVILRVSKSKAKKDMYGLYSTRQGIFIWPPF